VDDQNQLATEKGEGGERDIAIAGKQWKHDEIMRGGRRRVDEANERRLDTKKHKCETPKRDA